jgi:cysteine-rich repeat protein
MVLCSRNFITIILFIPFFLGLIFSSIFLAYKYAEADQVPTSVIITICGNGTPEQGEFCDDGANNGRYAYNAADRFCNLTCSGWAPYCGDGILQSGYGEECDDGNNISGDGCDAACKGEAAPPPPAGGGGALPSVPTEVILQGKAYPGSNVNILQDGKLIGACKTDSKADFIYEITDITPGVYTFGLWAEDKDGIKSITYTLTFRVTANTITTVSGIFLPPTIGLNKTVLSKGEILNIFGQTVPEVEIDIRVLSSEIIATTTSDKIGVWLLLFNTTPLEKGPHNTKAQFLLNTKEKSGFGKVLTFYIGEKVIPPKEVCVRADLNNDGRVNLVDFSIFLCWWGKINPQCDLNNNGVVDLPDFSIFLCCWTG